MRKVFLEELPKIESGANKGKINWSKSIGFKILFIYDDVEGYVRIVDYTNGVILINYKDYEYSFTISCFKKCQFGVMLKKYNSNEFKIDVDSTMNGLTIINKRYKLYERPYKSYNLKQYQYICDKCGFNSSKGHYRNGKYENEFWIGENELFKGNSCSCCHNLIVVPEINSIVANKETHWMIQYFQGGYDEAKMYTKTSSKRLYFKCPDCGRIKNKAVTISNIYSNHSIGCPCGDGYSYLSKYIMSTLKQVNANFETEVRYKWNKYKTLDAKSHQAYIDFVIYYEGREIPLEADGGFHRNNNNMTGQSKEESEYIDKQRDENCLRYLGEKTIRISDDGELKDNILSSELNKIFDLSNINWNKCEEFAINNLCKEICEYWNNKEEWETTTDLVKLFKVSDTCIRDYLKKGTELGWCVYDIDYERKIGYKKSNERKFKPIEIFKDGISLGKFKGADDLCQYMYETHGVNLTKRNVYKVAKGERKHHKNYTFVYI